MQFIQSVVIKKNTQWLHSICYACLMVLCALFVNSCSPLRELEEDQFYLKKNTIKIHSDIPRNEKQELEEILESIIVQKSNTYILGLVPYKVWLYNIRAKKYEADTNNFQIKNRVVEKPVVFDPSAIEQTKEMMRNHLVNAGFFNNIIYHELNVSNEQKMKVHYHINTGSRFLISKIQYQVPDDYVKGIIKEYIQTSQIAQGRYYSNTIAAVERNNITQLMKRNGYYHFNAENIRFELDTVSTFVGEVQHPIWEKTLVELFKNQTLKPSSSAIQLKVIVNDNKDSTSFKSSRIGNVIVYLNMTDSMQLLDLYRRMNVYPAKDNVQIIDAGNNYINHSLIDRKVFLRPGALYSIEDYDKTMRHLNELGVFRFVRMRFSDVVDPETGEVVVNALILLAPNDKYDFNANLEFSGGDIYTFGTAAKVSVTNKNIFKGANQFTTTLSYGLELEDKDNTLKLFSQNFGVNMNLLFPKFLLPVSQDKFSPSNFPRTFLSLGLNNMHRTNFFNLRSINASMNYQWNETSQKIWTIKPLFTNLLYLSDISETFQNRMDSIPSIRNAYQQTFVLGEGIEFIYNSSPQNLRSKTFIKLGFEESGLLLNGIDALSPISKFSEYIRLDFDTRHQFTRSFSTLAFRFHGGIGIPYGKNTSTLPYIKQYFVGGAYSIRGWRPRVLGPGSYYDPYSRDGSSNLFVDQSGDIKLELNAEYRFDIVQLFANAVNVNGAIFSDAGNIWLAKKDLKMPNAEFNVNRLYQDIAISSGAGLRIVFGGFIVLRLDYAFPIKKPYEPFNYGWVLDKIDFTNPDWRRENLNFNLAVGFPF